MRVEMAPEDELCLLFARAELSPEARDRALNLLAGLSDWPRLFQCARRHEIFPLLYAGLRTLGFPGVPDPVRSEWTKIFRLNAIRNELLAGELARLLRLLGDAGIPVMPVKGIALAESLYGDPALRICADIDILVPPERFGEAFHFLLASGYEAGFTQPALVALLARYGKDCLLMRQDSACLYPLQLHCGLIWGGPAERSLAEEIWSEASRITFRGVPAFALSAEWEFLYYAIHAARHGLFPLKWLVDLDRICTRGNLDWERVKEKAKLLGWKRAVQSTLSACATLLDTPAPALFLATAPPAPVTLKASVPSALQIPRETLFGLRLITSPAGRLRFLAIRLFVPTPGDCRLVPLPSRLFFLYYALRPLRVAGMVIGWLFQAIWEGIGSGDKRREDGGVA
jgi:hypothetical protein